MNEIFEKIYNNNNTNLNEDTALFEKVYTEAEMLNEMNPKLRALLAAGLIGTAGLGAASCSMPTDDPYDVQYTIEQPTPENPEEIEEIEDSEDSEEIMDSEEIENSGEIEDSEDSEDSENSVTFETLGVEKYAESLARARKATSKGEVKEYNVVLVSDKTVDLVYREGHFIDALDEDQDGQEDISEHTDETFICYKDNSASIRYYVPTSMEKKFDNAIKIYRNTH